MIHPGSHGTFHWLPCGSSLKSPYSQVQAFTGALSPKPVRTKNRAELSEVPKASSRAIFNRAPLRLAHMICATCRCCEAQSRKPEGIILKQNLFPAMRCQMVSIQFTIPQTGYVASSPNSLSVLQLPGKTDLCEFILKEKENNASKFCSLS